MFLALPVLATTSSARGVLFNSLNGTMTSAAFAGGIEPVMSATFSTGATPVRVDVALLLRDDLPNFAEPNDTYTVSLDGGISTSNLSFDPISGLNYVNGSPVNFKGPVIKSVTLPMTSLPAAWTVQQYNQFASVLLNPNSLYWIEVRVNSQSEIEWGTTADVFGPGVASNYLAWSATDDGFFLNKGIDPFPSDNALQMEVNAAPEPSTWAMMLVGFAGLGYAGFRRAREPQA